MPGVLKRKEREIRLAQGKPCEDTDREQGDAASRMPGAAGNSKEEGSPRIFEGSTALPTP